MNESPWLYTFSRPSWYPKCSIPPMPPFRIRRWEPTVSLAIIRGEWTCDQSSSDVRCSVFGYYKLSLLIRSVTNSILLNMWANLGSRCMTLQHIQTSIASHLWHSDALFYCGPAGRLPRTFVRQHNSGGIGRAFCLWTGCSLHQLVDPWHSAFPHCAPVHSLHTYYWTVAHLFAGRCAISTPFLANYMPRKSH